MFPDSEDALGFKNPVFCRAEIAFNSTVLFANAVSCCIFLVLSKCGLLPIRRIPSLREDVPSPPFVFFFSLLRQDARPQPSEKMRHHILLPPSPSPPPIPRTWCPPRARHAAVGRPWLRDPAPAEEARERGRGREPRQSGRAENREAPGPPPSPERSFGCGAARLLRHIGVRWLMCFASNCAGVLSHFLFGRSYC
jgi:hypothetical protein